jgi:hypothetical protein
VAEIEFPPRAEHFLRALAGASAEAWRQAGARYAAARRGLFFAEARRMLHQAVASAARDPYDAAVSDEFNRRVTDAVEALRLVIASPAERADMRRAALTAAHAYAFAPRLTPPDLELLGTPFRDAGIALRPGHPCGASPSQQER